MFDLSKGTRFGSSPYIPQIAGSVGGYQPLSFSGLPSVDIPPPAATSFLPSFNNDGKMMNPGWGGTALQLGQALFSGYMGMKQYGLMKDQLAEGKKQFAMNFDAQRRTTNAQLEDRQRARLASNPNAYQSVGEYMAKYGIQGG